MAHASVPLRTAKDELAEARDRFLAAEPVDQLFRLDAVGHFFAPTIYQKEIQAIRTNYLRDLYWVQHRGLLSDGHVRNLEDLVDPDRCSEGSTRGTTLSR